MERVEGRGSLMEGAKTGRGSRRFHGTRITPISRDADLTGRRSRGSRITTASLASPGWRGRSPAGDPRSPRPVPTGLTRAIRVPSPVVFDPRDPRPVEMFIHDPRCVNTSVRRCSVRNRLAISIQPVGQSNSTGTRKCAARPLARTRLGPVDSWHRLLRRLVETFEKRLVSNRASGKYASLEGEPVASGTGIAHICGTAILAAAPRSICGVAPLV